MENSTVKKQQLGQIESALRNHYSIEGYIVKEMLRAENNLMAGKRYYFRAGLFGTKYDNREVRIFERDGVYARRFGWGKSSDSCFN